jgi:hypothetical protein
VTFSPDKNGTEAMLRVFDHGSILTSSLHAASCGSYCINICIGLPGGGLKLPPPAALDSKGT